MPNDANFLCHDWNVSEAEAIAIQNRLAPFAIRQDDFGVIRRIAGVDVAYNKSDCKIFAVIVIIDAISGKIVETNVAVGDVIFPYVPGLFAFRELPHLLGLLESISEKPDLIICDGQGIAHPRRCGIATHLGLLAKVPTIGCGKTRHVGSFGELGEERGATSDLVDSGEVVGKALRTQDGVKPLFVSIGHRVSLNTAVDWILKLASKYRQPEPIRLANELACKTRASFRNSY